MVQIVNAVMFERRKWIVPLVLSAGAVVFFTALLVTIISYRIDRDARIESGTQLERHLQLKQTVHGLFAGLRKELTATPCSPAFQTQLRRIAFMQEGITELLYASDGKVRCSSAATSFDPPIDLGEPDIAVGDGFSMWMFRDLTAFNLPGSVGSIVLNGDLGVIIPPQPFAAAGTNWLDLEGVMAASNGRQWHLSGLKGIYEGFLAEPGSWLRGSVCDGSPRTCIAYRIHPLRFVAERKAEIALCVLLLASATVALVTILAAWIKRYCSFENRFCRHLGPNSIICSYQPVMDLRTGRITGCEVLARWRDLDGSIVFPDRFIPLVEREGLTLAFTRLVVEKAMKELSEALPESLHLHVAFNVFPVDLANKNLPDVFRGCHRDRRRFSIIAEIVESAAFAACEARAQIEALRREGVQVYLDDFGAGYSNIQNLALLPIEGVKLDRAFAIAPDDSLMSRMLEHVIDLINVSGRVIVVEGVETANRLVSLLALGSTVDRVQGYHISRPLTIDNFVVFMAAANECETNIGTPDSEPLEPVPFLDRVRSHPPQRHMTNHVLSATVFGG